MCLLVNCYNRSMKETEWTNTRKFRHRYTNKCNIKRTKLLLVGKKWQKFNIGKKRIGRTLRSNVIEEIYKKTNK